ncbi:hypothetical protein FRB98_006372 [Tulasnella sp. 332]|nr:hypothetical protein FRB98_006372 [Tulasnella sp. 332]
MTRPDRPLSAYLAILGLLKIPPVACISSTLGIFILAVCIYTTLLPLRYQRTLRYLRMLLSLPGAYCFIDFGWSTWYERTHNRSTFLALGTVACYGMMRLLETCWIRELDGDTPKWKLKSTYRAPVKRVESPKGQASKGNGDGDEVRHTVSPPQFILALPTRPWKRVLYTLDLLTNIRGSSWFADRTWDFAPAYVSTFMPPTGTSRILFIRSQIMSIAAQYLVMDVLDTLIRSQDQLWSKASARPVTTFRSVPLQLAASLAVCTTTILYLTIPYATLSATAVAMGSSPTSWPPIVSNPLSSHSLAHFWGRGWHHIFRRVFNRISMAILWPFRSSSASYITAARKVIIFFLSATLHLVLLTTLQPRPPSPDNPNPRSHKSMFEPGTIKFFLSQPLGLYIESSIILPLVRNGSQRVQMNVCRVFAWCWLLWTGRWWADAWIGGGMYDETERPIVWSPLRGLMWGTWII